MMATYPAAITDRSWILEFYNEHLDKLFEKSFIAPARAVKMPNSVSYLKWNKALPTNLMVQKGTMVGTYQVYQNYYEMNNDYNGSYKETLTKNIVGDICGALYPVDLKAGTKITMTAQDSTVISDTSYVITLWKKNGDKIKDISYINPSRTVAVEQDTSYISWNKELPTPIQITIGGATTDFCSYILPSKVETTGKYFNETKNVGGIEVQLYNPYKSKGTNQYKGQLHCHTTNTDGLMSPQQLVNLYANAGYDFMTITDHNYITTEPENMYGMVWLCNSIEDTHQEYGFQHSGIYNIKSIVNRINQYNNTNNLKNIIEHYVKEQNATVSICHPNDASLGGMPDERVYLLDKGFSFVEIFNGTDNQIDNGSVISVDNYSDLPAAGKGIYIYYVRSEDKYYRSYGASATTLARRYSQVDESVVNFMLDNNLFDPIRTYCNMLDNGLKVFGLGVDDCHSLGSFDMAWINVFAAEKTKASIWDAMCRGAFYSSTGVVLSDISYSNSNLQLTINSSEPDANIVTSFYGKNEEVLYQAIGKNPIYEVTGDEKYVFAQVKIGNAYAWTNPIFIVNKKHIFDM